MGVAVGQRAGARVGCGAGGGCGRHSVGDARAGRRLEGGCGVGCWCRRQCAAVAVMAVPARSANGPWSVGFRAARVVRRSSLPRHAAGGRLDGQGLQFWATRRSSASRVHRLYAMFRACARESCTAGVICWRSTVAVGDVKLRVTQRYDGWTVVCPWWRRGVTKQRWRWLAS